MKIYITLGYIIRKLFFATHADGGNFGFWAPEFLLKCPKNSKQVRKNAGKRLVMDPRKNDLTSQKIKDFQQAITDKCYKVVLSKLVRSIYNSIKQAWKNTKLIGLIVV